MGEWATYFVVNNYRRQHATSNISDRVFFETEKFVSGPCGPFDETYHYLQALDLIVPTDNSHLRSAQCEYKNIWNKIYSTFPRSKSDSVSLFFDCAHDWQDSPLTSSEKEMFTIDSGCKPLFDKFEAEQYVFVSGKHYYWSPKLRPYFEARNFWKPTGNVERHVLERSIINNLDKACVAELNILASNNDKISAVYVLQKSLVFRSAIKSHKLISYITALKVVELMFPSVWGKQNNETLHWKWYGEVPSQGKL